MGSDEAGNTGSTAISVAFPQCDLLRFRLVLLGILLTGLLASQVPIPSAEAKFPQGNYGNVEQTYAVFTMIALAIAGFGILLALYTRESLAINGS